MYFMDDNETIEYMRKKYGMSDSEARLQIRQAAELDQIAYLVGNFIVKEMTTPKLIDGARLYEAINYVTERMIEGSQMMETQIRQVQQLSDEEAAELVKKPRWER